MPLIGSLPPPIANIRYWPGPIPNIRYWSAFAIGAVQSDGSRGSWWSSLRWVKTTSFEIYWVATGQKRCAHNNVFGGKSFFQSLPSQHKRATNDEFSLLRLHHHQHHHYHHSPHNHTTTAGIAALAENALFAENLTLPANAAFT